MIIWLSLNVKKAGKYQLSKKEASTKQEATMNQEGKECTRKKKISTLNWTFWVPPFLYQFFMEVRIKNVLIRRGLTASLTFKQKRFAVKWLTLTSIGVDNVS